MLILASNSPRRREIMTQLVADQYIRNTSQTKYTYISEDDARKYLGVSCVYVGGTDWAILVPAGNEAEISELAKMIEEALEKGGK